MWFFLKKKLTGKVYCDSYQWVMISLHKLDYQNFFLFVNYLWVILYIFLFLSKPLTWTTFFNDNIGSDSAVSMISRWSLKRIQLLFWLNYAGQHALEALLKRSSSSQKFQIQIPHGDKKLFNKNWDQMNIVSQPFHG